MLGIALIGRVRWSSPLVLAAAVGVAFAFISGGPRGRDTYLVPLICLGRDLEFDDLAHNWGLSAVILANGAWRDRPFPVEGADQFVDRGLIYQNPLIYWFNVPVPRKTRDLLGIPYRRGQTPAYAADHPSESAESAESAFPAAA